MRHHTSRTDHGIAADGNPGTDDRAATNPYRRTDSHRLAELLTGPSEFRINRMRRGIDLYLGRQ